MGLFKFIGALLSGQTISTSTSTSTLTTTSSSAGSLAGPRGRTGLPSAVTSTSSSAGTSRRTINGVTQQARVSFARYTIDPADLPAWTDRLSPIPTPADLPPPPAGADWWLPPDDAAVARYYDARPLTGGDGFVAVSPDSQTLYVYSASAMG